MAEEDIQAFRVSWIWKLGNATEPSNNSSKRLRIGESDG